MKNGLYIILFFFALSGCSNKSDSMTNEEKIAGTEEKTWKAQKETDATGDKDKLTKNEKRQTITFWRNGNVKMGDGDQMMSGQWKLEGSNLGLVFTGSDVSENFTLLELDNNEMKLKAGDGSEMTMKPD
ncbi:MAG: lipocalin family protein [Cyclobacteriaceae bacterium]